jgi:hypothetical protein
MSDIFPSINDHCGVLADISRLTHPAPPGIPRGPYYTEFKRNANPYLPGRPLQVYRISTDNIFRMGNFPPDGPFTG